MTLRSGRIRANLSGKDNPRETKGTSKTTKPPPATASAPSSTTAAKTTPSPTTPSAATEEPKKTLPWASRKRARPSSSQPTSTTMTPAGPSSTATTTAGDSKKTIEPSPYTRAALLNKIVTTSPLVVVQHRRQASLASPPPAPPPVPPSPLPAPSAPSEVSRVPRTGCRQPVRADCSNTSNVAQAPAVLSPSIGPRLLRVRAERERRRAARSAVSAAAAAASPAPVVTEECRTEAAITGRSTVVTVPDEKRRGVDVEEKKVSKDDVTGDGGRGDAGDADDDWGRGSVSDASPKAPADGGLTKAPKHRDGLAPLLGNGGDTVVEWPSDARIRASNRSETGLDGKKAQKGRVLEKVNGATENSAGHGSSGGSRRWRRRHDSWLRKPSRDDTALHAPPETPPQPRRWFTNIKLPDMVARHRPTHITDHGGIVAVNRSPDPPSTDGGATAAHEKSRYRCSESNSEGQAGSRKDGSGGDAHSVSKMNRGSHDGSSFTHTPNGAAATAQRAWTHGTYSPIPLRRWWSSSPNPLQKVRSPTAASRSGGHPPACPVYRVPGIRSTWQWGPDGMPVPPPLQSFGDMAHRPTADAAADLGREQPREDPDRLTTSGAIQLRSPASRSFDCSDRSLANQGDPSLGEEGHRDRRKCSGGEKELILPPAPRLPGL